MGLDYLNKKVWHPGSMKNIQKVWQAEQIQKEINKKGKERAKKLVEERHNEDLKKIQVEAGLIPRSHLERMDWMYDWGNKIHQQEKNNQQYLTGKAKVDPKEAKHVFQEEITNKKCQDFTLLHEDPLFEIQRQQKLRKDALLSNPIEMRHVIKEVEQEYLPADLHQRRKQQRSQRQYNNSSSQSRSRSRDKKSKDRENTTSDRKSYKQSKLYKSYLKDRFGNILKSDQQGNYKPDYTIYKSKYQTQHQIDEQERLKRIEKLRENVVKLKEMRESHTGNEQSQPHRNFDEGISRIRLKQVEDLRTNRNHLKYRHSDSE